MALLETLVATAMGGGFALLGSYLTNKFARQNSEEQRNHEKWKAKRDSYLAKGEETHALFNQWMINAAKISTIYSFRMNGAFNAEDAAGNDSNLLIVFYVQIMPDDFVMQLHRF